MSGKKERSGGRNAVPCRWNGLDFSSFAAFDDYHGLSRGYARSYWKANRDYLGLPIVIEAIDRRRTRTDKDMISFYSFVNARRSLLADPNINLKEMLNLFDQDKL